MIKPVLFVLLLSAAVPAAADVTRLANWGDGSTAPCKHFARTSGFCTKNGRWVVIRSGVGTVYLPDGRTMQMPLIEAEANGALSSDGSVSQHRERDNEIDDALDRADVPY